MREWDAESARLATRALAAGRPTAWFEELYAAGGREEIAYPTSPVDYRTADLFALPDGWAFDLVVEIINLQALPVSLRAEAVAAVAGLVAPGGTLLSSRTCGPGRSRRDPHGPSPGRRSRRSPTTGSTR